MEWTYYAIYHPSLRPHLRIYCNKTHNPVPIPERAREERTWFRLVTRSPSNFQTEWGSGALKKLERLVLCAVKDSMFAETANISLSFGNPVFVSLLFINVWLLVTFALNLFPGAPFESTVYLYFSLQTSTEAKRNCCITQKRKPISE